MRNLKNRRERKALRRGETARPAPAGTRPRHARSRRGPARDRRTGEIAARARSRHRSSPRTAHVRSFLSVETCHFGIFTSFQAVRSKFCSAPRPCLPRRRRQVTPRATLYMVALRRSHCDPVSSHTATQSLSRSQLTDDQLQSRYSNEYMLDVGSGLHPHPCVPRLHSAAYCCSENERHITPSAASPLECSAREAVGKSGRGITLHMRKTASSSCSGPSPAEDRLVVKCLLMEARLVADRLVPKGTSAVTGA